MRVLILRRHWDWRRIEISVGVTGRGVIVETGKGEGQKISSWFHQEP